MRKVSYKEVIVGFGMITTLINLYLSDRGLLPPNIRIEPYYFSLAATYLALPGVIFREPSRSKELKED